MTYRYRTKEGIFETDYYFEIPWNDLHSPNELTPALTTFYGVNLYFCEGKQHRLNGPAYESLEYPDFNNEYWLNGIEYSFEEWCEIHPDKTVLAIYLLQQ